MKAVVFSANITVPCAGKDITHKLYSLNERLAEMASNDIAANTGRPSDYWRCISRSLSVDAVHTGTRGHVRSQAWRNQHQRRTSATLSDSKLASVYTESVIALMMSWISELFSTASSVRTVRSLNNYLPTNIRDIGKSK
jgi:hypothetical protein